jgi:hypothetical protein
VFVEHFEQVGLEVAALVEHHLRARLHLLYVLLLELQPGLQLADPHLHLPPRLLVLLLDGLDLAVQPSDLRR